MDYGPALCHAITFVEPTDRNAATWDGSITRSFNVRLSDDRTLCYDLNRMSVAAWWSGKFLDISNTHLTSYKGGLPPRPGSKPIFLDLASPGWLAGGESVTPQFHGYYYHQRNVALAYTVGKRHVVETPSMIGKLLCRTFQVEAGEQSLAVVLGDTSKSKLVAAVKCEEAKVKVETADNLLLVRIPPLKRSIRLTVAFSAAADSNQAALAKQMNAMSLPSEIDWSRGGPRRWADVVTSGKRAADDSAYVVDNLTVPVEPYQAWMRLSAIDAFDDGSLAVATLSGDVWIATFDDDLRKINWRRYATGLYEPLGLKVVGGVVYTRGRDRITRLHDLNQDGEADYYENFYSQEEIGPGYHGFLFDLVTDRQNNFYFARSGRKAPTIGAVVKVSSDGKHREEVGTMMRHANGLGSGGPDDWVLMADNADGKFPAGASIMKSGKRYGYNGPRTEPMLYVLPPKVDTSSASQCWTDPTRFGPLGGLIAHTSYSHSTMCYVMVQKSKPYANGFAVKLPWGFQSGVMRVCVNPRDGQLYVAEQRGWDSNAALDGAIQRIRYTGKPSYLVTSAKAAGVNIDLTFSCDLDPDTVDFDNFYAERIGKQQQEIDIDDVVLIDVRTVRVIFFDEFTNVVDQQMTKKTGETCFQVLDPLAIEFNIKSKNGVAIKETVYATINSIGK